MVPWKVEDYLQQLEVTETVQLGTDTTGPVSGSDVFPLVHLTLDPGLRTHPHAYESSNP